ncbi:MAG: amidohydrolase family protein [Parcubacteria group bacterium]|nr:amidohydrolase family protein [Parcubacteria group bacterium]
MFMFDNVFLTRALIAGVVFLAGGGIFLAANSNNPFAGKITSKTKCPESPYVREFSHTPYYTGPLIDSHVHMPVSSGIVSSVAEKLGFKSPLFGGFTFGSGEKLTLDYTACLFKREGTKGVFGFFLATKFSSGAEIKTMKKAASAYKDLFVPFWMPAPYPYLRANTTILKDMVEKNKNLIKGIGELKIFDGSKFDNSHFTELFAIAEEYNLIVMSHPDETDVATVEKIIKDHPKISFLIHGHESADVIMVNWVMEMMRKYNNVYYTMDTIQKIFGWKKEHQFAPPNRDEYLLHLRGEFDALLTEGVSGWKHAIETYPDRFLWGTDRWNGWMFDREVGGLTVELYRAFIGKLAPGVQEKYAYKNAERLLENAGKK